jgi:glycosyltransferase involved in cell wall biosynthesis
VLTFHTGGHSNPWRTAIRGAQWRALRGLLRRANALIAVCEFEVDYFSSVLRLPRDCFRLIQNGSEPLPIVQNTVAPFAGEPLILSIGRLERYKGHHRVIRAMPEILRVRPEARLVVVGTGPYEHSLRKLTRELGIERSLSFVSYGPDQRGTLGALVRSSGVVALISDYEAHPVAVMEVLALGKPVVVANTSGLAELTKLDLVTSVDLNAPSEVLAKVLLSAVVSGDGSANGLGLPTWDRCTDELLATYREVSKKPSS